MNAKERRLSNPEMSKSDAKAITSYAIQVQGIMNELQWHDAIENLPTVQKAKAKLKKLRAEYDRSPDGHKLVLRLIRRDTTISEQVLR